MSIKKDKKNILVLPRWYPHRGDVQLGNFIRQQAQLIAHDFNIFVIYVQAEADLKTTFEFELKNENNVSEVIVYYKKGNGILAKYINAKRYKKAQQLAFKKLNILPDLCHVHVPYRSAFLALALLRKNKVPFVITEHWSGHLTGDFNNKNTLDKKLYRNVVNKAIGVTCVSKLLAKKFEENTGYPADIIPNYIEFSNAANQKIDKEEIQILSVSDMNDEVKGIRELLHAFSRALELKKNLSLKIIGGGPDERKIQNLVADLNLQEKVSLMGRQPHGIVLKEISHCDFYICNSKFETFGMAVAEALIAGKPVVCSRCGGPEEFLNKENSIISQPSNLTQKIIEMSEQFRNFNPQNISEEIQSKYGKETIRKNWLDFYSKFLDSVG